MIDMTRQARNFLEDLQSKQFKQVTKRIISLLENPYPEDCKHLSGHPGVRRIDVGEYRVCYRVSEKVVFVIVVGPRNDSAVYNMLRRTGG